MRFLLLNILIYIFVQNHHNCSFGYYRGSPISVLSISSLLVDRSLYVLYTVLLNTRILAQIGINCISAHVILIQNTQIRLSILLRSLDMPTQLSLGSLSLVWNLTMKKGIGLPCTNWSGVGVALLMSPRQGKTSQHKGIKQRGKLGLMKVSM